MLYPLCGKFEFGMLSERSTFSLRCNKREKNHIIKIIDSTYTKQRQNTRVRVLLTHTQRDIRYNQTSFVSFLQSLITAFLVLLSVLCIACNQRIICAYMRFFFKFTARNCSVYVPDSHLKVLRKCCVAYETLPRTV